MHPEAVEDGVIVAVVLKAVDQVLVLFGLRGLGAPDDALVQVGDAHAVAFVVVGEEELLLGLGYAVDAARVGGLEDVLFDLLAGVGLEVALRDLHTRGSVAADAHSAKVHDVGV